LGLETTLAQVIADDLGARIEDIRILQGDSAVVAHGTGTYASRSAVLAGGAAVLAARLLKERVIRAASYLLEASVEDIEAADGRIFVGGTDRSLTFREIAEAVYSEMGACRGTRGRGWRSPRSMIRISARRARQRTS
jgi:carbon-monoxide dehydrogenase large subunit